MHGLMAINPLIHLASNEMLDAQLREQELARAAAAAPPEPDVPQLAGYVRTQWEIFRNHRNTASGWSERLLEALRTFKGQYSPAKLQEVQKFKGSEVYARLTAQKCRAASSLLPMSISGVIGRGRSSRRPTPTCRPASSRRSTRS